MNMLKIVFNFHLDIKFKAFILENVSYKQLLYAWGYSHSMHEQLMTVCKQPWNEEMPRGFRISMHISNWKLHLSVKVDTPTMTSLFFQETNAAFDYFPRII